jgi:hypothetical protein
MSCHESAENSEPDCATDNATSNPNALPAATPSAGSYAPSLNKPVKLTFTAEALQPRKSPARMSAPSAAVLAVVNRFCTILPYSRPRELAHVSSAITAMPTSCAVESEMAYRDEM